MPIDFPVGPAILLERREPKRVTLVTITSDRGLAGGFNANITRAVQRFTVEHPEIELAQTALYLRAERRKRISDFHRPVRAARVGLYRPR